MYLTGGAALVFGVISVVIYYKSLFSDQTNLLGLICDVVTILMFASPLSTLVSRLVLFSQSVQCNKFLYRAICHQGLFYYKNLKVKCPLFLNIAPSKWIFPSETIPFYHKL